MGEIHHNLNCWLNGNPNLIQHPPIRGRFAPSPSGPLHFGSIVAALGSWLFARSNQGIWLVRIEDVDRQRCDRNTALQQLEHLELLGMRSEESVEWQSANSDRYEQELRRLVERGDAFECRCSRADVAAMGGVHHQCVAKNDDTPAGIRFRVPPDTTVEFEDLLLGKQRQNVYTDVGDILLRRANGDWTYQFAVVVDDHAQRINQVVRGADLLDSTARQILLQQALGYATPDYAHLPLLLDLHGRKLSKSQDDPPAIRQLTDPTDVLQAAWRALNQKAVIESTAPQEFLAKAVRVFDWTCLRTE